MNRNVERLYNGIIKENPTFVLMLRYVSDIGSYIFCHQRTWNGTFNNCGFSNVKPVDLRIS